MAAFDGVSLGNGVSLHEADVIDDYGTEDGRAAASESNELTDWQRIPEKETENHSSGLCLWTTKACDFISPHSFVLRFFGIVNRFFMSTNSTIYLPSAPVCITRLLAFLTDR